MTLFNWFLDGIILLANVGLAVILLTMIGGGARFGLRANDVYAERVPWLPFLMAGIYGAIVRAVWLGLYWLTYRLTGFPMWMGWIFG